VAKFRSHHERSGYALSHHHHPERSLEAAKQLRANIAAYLKTEENGGELSADDLQTLQDTFDGETTLDSEIRAAMLLIRDDTIRITGCKAELDNLRARKERFERRIETWRGFIEQAMAVANWPRLELDIATISCGQAGPRVVVTEENEIPSQFFKRQDPVLDKAGLNRVVLERHKALTAALAITDESERKATIERIDQEMPAIPGVIVETGGVKLNIRTK
jgi:Siphovirus Gp157